MKKLALLAVLLALPALEVLGGDKPEKTLTEHLEKLIAAGQGDGKKLRIPKADDWFAKTFGAEKGKALAAGYAAETKQLDYKIDQLARVAGVVGMKVTVHAVDPEHASRIEKRILSLMKKPVTLYVARLTHRGGRPWTLGPFVDVDGPRFLGRLHAFDEKIDDAADDEDDAIVPAIDAKLVAVGDKTLISVGSEDRVEEGYFFWITRGQETVGRLVVEKLEADSSICRVVSTTAGARPQAGDSVATKAR